MTAVSIAVQTQDTLNIFHPVKPVSFTISATLTGPVDRWADGVVRCAEVELADGQRLWVPADAVLEDGERGGLYRFPAEMGATEVSHG